MKGYAETRRDTQKCSPWIVDQLLLALKQRQIWYPPFELMYWTHPERVALWVYFDCCFIFGTKTFKDYVSPWLWCLGYPDCSAFFERESIFNLLCMNKEQDIYIYNYKVYNMIYWPWGELISWAFKVPRHQQKCRHFLRSHAQEEVGLLAK